VDILKDMPDGFGTIKKASGSIK